MGQVVSRRAQQRLDPSQQFMEQPCNTYSRATKPPDLNPVINNSNDSAKKDSLKIGFIFLDRSMF